ncbi:helix-turn-helix domain-containing protein [Acinetobacter sp. MD2(2019)]|uniref:helix-turn-helix domain-containing protein n=1 Tax=Acinetobacter sp. MD2(2019) TaxID=2605273 RepID=UPI002D1F50F2|nr:helix-turn-helix domain-containing protein [Acinetobacter sp. MD2(2019)]MEB3754306.1 DNA-binding protein [Acinetobacter sp. MD2(2019)]
MTHEIQILNHLKNGDSITVIEAGNLYHCHSLSGTISRLRQAGHNIADVWESNVLNKGRHKRYFLAGEFEA